MLSQQTGNRSRSIGKNDAGGEVGRHPRPGNESDRGVVGALYGSRKAKHRTRITGIWMRPPSDRVGVLYGYVEVIGVPLVGNVDGLRGAGCGHWVGAMSRL